jgi:hypothetical protein
VYLPKPSRNDKLRSFARSAFSVPCVLASLSLFAICIYIPCREQRGTLGLSPTKFAM